VLDATPLLLYSSTATDPEPYNTMDDYHHSDEWSGGAWVTAGDKSAVIFVGTKGTSNCNGTISGENAWEYEGKNVNGMDQEHIDLINSIRSGNVLNEGQRIAESTLTAIGAHMAACTGQVISWDWLIRLLASG